MNEANPNMPTTERRHPVWVWMIGPGLVMLLVLTYLIAPGYYLEWVIAFESRERQIVEFVTFGAALIAAVMLLGTAWRMRGGASTSWRDRGGTIVIALVGAAALFFAGEEVSWGQWIFNWETPDLFRETIQSGETNLHNADLPINLNSLGSVFLIVVFVLLPLAWHRRWPAQIPQAWRPAIAEGPVIFLVICAFVWKEVKSLYLFVNRQSEEGTVYVEFFEQVNEHKEMMVAVALFMYGVYRIRGGPQLTAPVEATS